MQIKTEKKIRSLYIMVPIPDIYAYFFYRLKINKE